MLEGERRVLSQRGVTAAIGLNPEVSFRMPDFLGGNGHGYPAEIIEHIIDTILEAERVGALPVRYAFVADRVRVLNRSLRRIGIIGLVDEATGLSGNTH